ncbi:S15 peptidase family protein [Nocardioides acrostichi]|uniref:ABC transporter ATP-binding protein n=1 Tax=Nocardioides acrostichi TaxID=2784339 RepID=A0A930V4Y6_9ACTN|nr:CocE/NonD family hydrolase [Nocardioides acrostichi]MBF4163264.1 ABC transporter ATP-binding protein [Nocardioides acrostichi]
MRRSVIAVTAILAGVLPAVGLSPSPALAVQPTDRAQAQQVEKTPLWFSVSVGGTNDTQCSIDADMYLPASASRSHRVPAILTTNGFGGSKDDQADFAQYFAGQGYAVLSYSGLGFGGSSCPISLDDRAHDGKAARFLVSYLGGQTGHAFLDSDLTEPAPRLSVVQRDRRDHEGHRSSHDPRVGMWGGSYGGGAQFAAAAVDPRIDTLVPLITWNDLSYSLAPNSIGQPSPRSVTSTVTGAPKLLWAGGFSALGVAGGLTGIQTDQARLLPCPDFQPWVCPGLVNAVATGTIDADTRARLHRRSVTSFMRKIRVPVLLAQGEGDTLFNLNEAIATYRALRQQGNTVKMIWSLGGHSHDYDPGEISAPYDPSTQYLVARFKRWFDHYLKGRRVGTGPGFAYYRDWVPHTGNARPAYASAPRYSDSRRTRLFLSDGTLVTDRAEVADSSSSFVTPAAGLPTSYDIADLVGAQAPVDNQDAPGTFASWTSAPLERAVRVVGSPRLRLRLQAPDLDAAGITVFVKVLDVAPDGSESLIRALVAPTRVIDPTAPQSIVMPAFAHRFAAGHSIRLKLAGGSINYRGNLQPSAVTITTGGPDQVLALPVR